MKMTKMLGGIDTAKTSGFGWSWSKASIERKVLLAVSTGKIIDIVETLNKPRNVEKVSVGVDCTDMSRISVKIKTSGCRNSIPPGLIAFTIGKTKAYNF